MVGFDGSKSMQMAPFCTQAFDLGSWNYYPCGDLEFWVGQPRKCTSQNVELMIHVLQIVAVAAEKFSRSIQSNASASPADPTCLFFVKRAHQKDQGVYGRAGRHVSKKEGAGGSIF